MTAEKGQTFKTRCKNFHENYICRIFPFRTLHVLWFQYRACLSNNNIEQHNDVTIHSYFFFFYIFFTTK
jgi:hypothetical protein